jgi:hypothetical protein
VRRQPGEAVARRCASAHRPRPDRDGSQLGSLGKPIDIAERVSASTAARELHLLPIRRIMSLTAIVVIAVVVLLLSGGGGYYWRSRR